MSTPALDQPLEVTAAARAATAATARRGSSFLEMAKPRLNLLVVLTALGGYYMAAHPGLSPWRLLFTLLGTGLVAGGAGALNQWLEREPDRRMERTRARPLPSGRLAPAAGLAFGATLAILGTALLALRVNLPTAGLGIVTCVAYLLFYTPLKRITPLNTLVGAVPGAIPPVMGWVAARGALGPEAAALFSILFFWQMPHFLAIAWLYREDYASAGFRMLPLEEGGDARTGFAAVLYAVALVPAALAPVLLGMAGPVYLAGASALTLGYVLAAVGLARRRSEAAARVLFRSSLVLLPALFLLMSLDKVTG